MLVDLRKVATDIVAPAAVCSTLYFVFQTQFMMFASVALFVLYLIIRTDFRNLKIDLMVQIPKLRLLISLVLIVSSIFAIVAVPSSSLVFIEWPSIRAELWLRLLITLPTYLFIPGLLLVSTVDYRRELDRFETVLYSFIVSIFIDHALGLIGLRVGEVVGVILAGYIALLIASFLSEQGFRKFRAEVKGNHGFHSRDPIVLDTKVLLVLSWFCVVYIIGWAMIYRNMAHMYFWGDMARHLGSSLYVQRGAIPRAQGFEWSDPGFNVFMGCCIKMTGFPPINNAILFHFVNILNVCSFYLLSRQLLVARGCNSIIFASCSYVLFSGLGWIVAAFLRIWGVANWMESAVSLSYLDVFYSNFPIQPIPFYFSCCGLLLLLALARRRTNSFLLVLVIGASSAGVCYLFHVPELIYALILLTAYALVIRTANLGALQTILVSVAVGIITIPFLSAISTFEYYYVYVPSSDILYTARIFMLPFGFLILLTIVSYLIVESRRRGLRSDKIPSIYELKRVGKLAVILLSTAWVVGVIVWFVLAPTFDSWKMLIIGRVPWYFFPIKLGVLGICGIAFLSLGWREKDRDIREVVSFSVIGFLMLFVASELVSIANILTTTYYYQYRFLYPLSICLSILAGLGLDSIWTRT